LRKFYCPRKCFVVAERRNSLFENNDCGRRNTHNQVKFPAAEKKVIRDIVHNCFDKFDPEKHKIILINPNAVNSYPAALASGKLRTVDKNDLEKCAGQLF